MDIVIRDAEERDIDAMAGLLEGLFAKEADFTPDRRRQEAGLALLLRSGAVALCAERQGEVVGMATMQFLVSTAMGAPSGLVEDVVVKDGLRGGGVGRRLLEELVRRAKEAGCRRLQLVADEDNAPAHGFYRHLGWRETNLRAWHRIGGEEPE